MFKFDATLMDFVRRDLDQGLIPMLLGEPGIGKSSWLVALADLMHTKCFTLACNQLADKADLTGARLVPVTDKAGNVISYKQVFYPHAVIHDAIEYAKANPRETPILFLDELNRTTPDVTSEALSIPTMRAIGSSTLPNNLRVVIAGNDKGNVTSLDEASISRFVLYRVGPDTQTFLGLDQNLNPFVKSVLTKHPDVIFCKTLQVAVAGKTGSKDDDDDDVDIEAILDDEGEMSQLTTPRTITGVSRWLNGFTNQQLMAALAATHMDDGVEISALQEGIEGHVGRTNFAALLLAEIAGNVMTTSNQSAVVQVAKPAVYDTFKAVTDRTALNDFVANMTDNDKSGCLVYLLYEKVDNMAFIQALAPAVNQLQPTDTRQLMALSSTGQLDSDNVKVLLDTNTPLANSLHVILELA